MKKSLKRKNLEERACSQSGNHFLKQQQVYYERDHTYILNIEQAGIVN